MTAAPGTLTRIGPVDHRRRTEDATLPVCFAGDVLFAGSIGRTDLPGGDDARLLSGIATTLLRRPTTPRCCPATVRRPRSGRSGPRTRSSSDSPGSPTPRPPHPRKDVTDCDCAIPGAPKGFPTTSAGVVAVRRRPRRTDTCGATGRLRHIELPAFEDTALFARGVGESTDVVSKEMYTFADRGDRSVTLRPELTAGVMRAFIEHGLYRGALPVKLGRRARFPVRAAADRPVPAAPAGRCRGHRRRRPRTRRGGHRHRRPGIPSPAD